MVPLKANVCSEISPFPFNLLNLTISMNERRTHSQFTVINSPFSLQEVVLMQ